MGLLKSIVLVGLFLVEYSMPSRILFLMPICSKSESHLLNPLAQSMLDRGHHVTLVSCASSSIKHKNLTEIIPVTPLDQGSLEPGNENVLDMRRAKDDFISKEAFTADMSFYTDRCHQTFQNEEFNITVLQQNNSYDLAVTGAMANDCFLGVIYKMNVPFIQLASIPVPKCVTDYTGFRVPLSFVPNPMAELTHEMSLQERLENTIGTWVMTFFNEQFFMKIGEKIYRQYLGDELPTAKVLRAKASMIFSNSHFSINFPRPHLPSVVEIGGVHCRPAKPLNKELNKFVSEAKHGFIFFSLGTVFKEESMPDSLKQMFFKVFSRLRQRVLWKWGSDPISGLPDNVKTNKWLQQQDILGHPNIKLFISHGGLLSTQEAIYHGVPILGIPLFADQDVNMKTAEVHGYAIKLELLDLTEEILESAINRMINETNFSENAKRASVVFRDQLVTPLERAAYWMEYLIRHNGAPHFRSAAQNLSYIEYYLYDVQSILFGLAAMVLVIAWKIVAACLTNFGADEGNENKRKRRKKYQ